VFRGLTGNLLFSRNWIFHEHRHILGYHTTLSSIRIESYIKTESTTKKITRIFFISNTHSLYVSWSPNSANRQPTFLISGYNLTYRSATGSLTKRLWLPFCFGLLKMSRDKKSPRFFGDFVPRDAAFTRIDEPPFWKSSRRRPWGHGWDTRSVETTIVSQLERVRAARKEMKQYQAMPWSRAGESLKKEATKLPKLFRASRCAAVQGKSHDVNVFRDITVRYVQQKRWLIRWSIEKISSVRSSLLLLQVSAWKT